MTFINKRTLRLLITHLSVLFLLPFAGICQKGIEHQIDIIAKTVKGNVGVAALNLSTGERFSYKANERYPMQSVYKFPIAIAVLHQIDEGKLSLSQKIHVTKEDLVTPHQHSPLRDLHPTADVDVSIEELLRYNVSESDGTACDALIRVLGGTQKIETYIHSLGIDSIAIATTEKVMGNDKYAQYKNWCKPDAMVKLLAAFYQKKVLSKASKDLLLEMMINTETGLKRIKGLLPKEAVVAHKTGTDFTDEAGITRATNDVGIVTLPSGKQFIIAIFISNSSDNTTDREAAIAKIAKATWDYWSK